MYHIGFDIGGSSIKAVLVRDKKVISRATKVLPKNMNALLSAVKDIKDEFESAIKPKRVSKAGFSVAGVLDKKRERMLKSPNIKYLDEKPLKKLFQQKLNLRNIIIENDANCFLIAEQAIGAGKKFKNIFYFIVGTGIGGALMIDDKVILGSHGSAGEAGHMIIDINKKIDLEDLSSNKFIKKSLGISAEEAFKKAKKGDKRAKKALLQLGENLGVGAANIINIIDPEALIISGGISSAKKFILPGVKKGIGRFVTSSEAKKTKIIFTRLGQYGGAIGAVLLFD